jgi:2,5-dihydroxypyridine 5,6-dioxygenase
MELVPLFRQMLELCLVRPRETVLVHSDTQVRSSYVAAFVGAAADLGADTAHLTLPTFHHAQQQGERDTGFEESFVVKAWQAANLVIDLTQGFWPGYMQLLELACTAGTRILCVNEPVDILKRTLPSAKDKARALASKAILKPGRQLRMVSEAGTDLTVDKTGRGVTNQYGYSDEPGHWDRWGRVHAATAPLEDSANGLLVIKPGDVIVPLGRYVSDPICLTLRDGQIVEIEGDGPDVYLLRDWFAQWKDPNAYTVSHIGWGLQEKADWSRMGTPWVETGGLNDCKGFYGSIPFAFGHNANFILRGRNESPAHLDITCRDCSLYVDDQMILDKGAFVVKELI